MVTTRRFGGGMLQFGRPTKHLLDGWPAVTPAFSQPVEEVVYVGTPNGWVYRDDSGLITPDGYSIISEAAAVIGSAAAREQAKKLLQSLKI